MPGLWHEDFQTLKGITARREGQSTRGVKLDRVACGQLCTLLSSFPARFLAFGGLGRFLGLPRPETDKRVFQISPDHHRASAASRRALLINHRQLIIAESEAD